MAQEEIRNNLVKRNFPHRGPTSSDAMNSYYEEVLRTLSLLLEAFNTYILPTLRGLPSRKNTGTLQSTSTTVVTDETDIDAVAHGLDGTQLFADNNAANASTDVWTGNEYDEMYYTGQRPRTVKEVFDFIHDQIDQIYTRLNEIANNVTNAISSQTSTVQQTSGIDSGNLAAITNNLMQLAKDLYVNGSTELTGEGEPTLASSLQAQLTSIQTAVNDVDELVNTTKLSDANIRSDASISSSKIGITNPSEFVKPSIQSLQDAINKLATKMGYLIHGTTGTFTDWENLPQVTNLNGESSVKIQSLKDHINHLGHGGSVASKPYNVAGNAPADFVENDTVQSYKDRSHNPDYKLEFTRDDINELLKVTTHYVVYDRDTLGRTNIETHYKTKSGTLLYKITYTYDGDTTNVLTETRVDYRRDNRIPGESSVTYKTTYTYNAQGDVLTEETVQV